MRHEIGIDKLMWGADYPHLEGAAPVHRETLRYIFGGMPEDDLRPILGGNAVDLWGFDADLLAGGGRPRRSRPWRIWPTPLELADIEDTFSWSLARPVPLAPALVARPSPRPPSLTRLFVGRIRPAPENGAGTAKSDPRRRQMLCPRTVFFVARISSAESHFSCHTVVLSSTSMQLDALRRIARGARRVGRRQLRRLRLHRGAAPAPWRASRPSSPRRRAAFETQRGVGGRRGQDGRGLDRHPLPGARAARPGAGCASGVPCATCPSAREAWRDGEIGVDQAKAIAAARRHRTEASMAEGRGACSSPRPPRWASRTSTGPCVTGSSWPTPTGADAADEERKAARNVYLEPSIDGMLLRPDDARPDLGIDRLRRAQPPGARPLRGRLRRGQGAPGRTGAPRRAGPYLGAAPGRRPRRDGDAQPDRSGRRHQTGAPLHRPRRLRDTARAHLRARERHRPRPGFPPALARGRLLRAGDLLAGDPGRRQRAGPALHRRDPPGPRAARPDVHPPLLLRARGELPG